MPLAEIAEIILSNVYWVKSFPPSKSQVSGLWHPGQCLSHPYKKNDTHTPGAAEKSFAIIPAYFTPLFLHV